MKKFVAIHGNTSRKIKAENIEEALSIAVKAANDCCDHTDDITVYSVFSTGELDYENCISE